MKYKRILLKLSGEVLKGSSDSCHDETILAEVAQPFDAREAIRLMGQGTVALFAGDTGNPFFSTDSGADLRAAEIGADALLKATKVDGIYSADPATGRIAESDGFAWDYLAGSNLKSKLTYPNDATAEWDYEPTRDLLARVTNTINGTVASQYTYTNDLLGRRTEIGKSGSMMALDETQSYGYNVRDELTSGQNQTYVYDDIGNRTTAEGKTYTANNLNQYTAIDDFTPQYDDDGNQTLIKTETGIWSVTYNAENRPIRWTQGDTVITMVFDRMGRRIEMRTQSADSDLLQRFVYDNYLCVQQLRGADNALFHSYVWDPTEPIATRPLILRDAAGSPFYYFHDGNKNVAGLIDHPRSASLAYAYSPYGTPSLLPSSLPLDNPFQFSSEVYDETLGLSYYNYRHYDMATGRWMARDPLGEDSGKNLVSFCRNSPILFFDYQGLLFGSIEEIPIPSFPNENAGQCTTLIVLIGGMSDDNSGVVGEQLFDIVKKEYPRAIIAYYHWTHARDAMSAANDYSQICPCSPVIIIGHSYGGSEAISNAEKLRGNRASPMVLLTLDPVGRSTWMHPDFKSANDISFWGNVHSVPSEYDFSDFVADLGGQFGSIWRKSKPDVNEDSSASHGDTRGLYDQIRDRLKQEVPPDL